MCVCVCVCVRVGVGVGVGCICVEYICVCVYTLLCVHSCEHSIKLASRLTNTVINLPNYVFVSQLGQCIPCSYVGTSECKPTPS